MITLREAAAQVTHRMAEIILGYGLDNLSDDAKHKQYAIAQGRLDALIAALAQPESEPKATPASDREALIAWHRAMQDVCRDSDGTAFLNHRDTADMLEADAQEIAGWKADQKENLANQCELQAQINAQQVAVPQPDYVPLTDEQAKKLCSVGPVYAPGGVVSRSPHSYRVELEQAMLTGFRIGEAVRGKT